MKINYHFLFIFCILHNQSFIAFDGGGPDTSEQDDGLGKTQEGTAGKDLREKETTTTGNTITDNTITDNTITDNTITDNTITDDEGITLNTNDEAWKKKSFFDMSWGQRWSWIKEKVTGNPTDPLDNAMYTVMDSVTLFKERIQKQDYYQAMSTLATFSNEIKAKIDNVITHNKKISENKKNEAAFTLLLTIRKYGDVMNNQFTNDQDTTNKMIKEWENFIKTRTYLKAS